MKKVFALNGSPRPNGNTSYLLKSFLNAAEENNAIVKCYDSCKLNISNCNGCLRCNLIKHCSITNDDWPEISQSILDSDIIVFAGPVYFHHFPASVKLVLDRFRSFIKVQITKESIRHEAWTEWNKDFVLLLSMGSSDDIDAKPVIELFEFITEVLGPGNKLHVISATRLAVNKQISFDGDELDKLYRKLQIPAELAHGDALLNKKRLHDCFDLGHRLTFENKQ